MTEPNRTTTATTTRRPDHIVERPDGRHLAVDDRAPSTSPHAPVVVLLHSAPGSRRFDPDPAATAAAGVRLITIDRAGYGESSPFAPPMVPSIPTHADDVAAVLDALDIAAAAVVGWSAGGRIALALAARRPDLVRAVAVVGTPAPDDEVPWVAPEHRAMATMLREDPASAHATVTNVFAQAGPPEGDAALDLASGGAADHAVRADPARRAALLAMLDEAFRHGPSGVAADIVADQVVPWGFDPRAVGAPVTLVYGDHDAIVTPDHGRWYAARLADAELTIVPDAGHLVVMTEWARILDAVARPDAG